jgi:hypothetical protein
MTSTELDRLAALLTRWVPESELREAYGTELSSGSVRGFRERGDSTIAQAYYLAIQALRTSHRDGTPIYSDGAWVSVCSCGWESEPDDGDGAYADAAWVEHADEMRDAASHVGSWR